jgi:anti-sigma factor (TIGR02949 family)
MTMMDCKTLLQLIQLYLDGEANTEQTELLLKHVNGCNDCRCIYEFETAFRSFLSKKMNEIPVSEGEISELQRKISEQIQINES